MGNMCCSSKKTGQEDRRRIIDHFMPPGELRHLPGALGVRWTVLNEHMAQPGAPLQPRYTYR
eukprot:2204897-Rhodomonas_salina.1